MRTFALGDPHGAFRALDQVLSRAQFDFEQDRLICLGDVADGWPEVRQCFDLLLQIENLVYLLGNHCEWLEQYWRTGFAAPQWVSQGGQGTLQSYSLHGVVEEHHRLLREGLPYYIDEERNFLFVHGGLPILPGDTPVADVTEYEPHALRWDRSMWKRANKEAVEARDRGDEEPRLTSYAKIFIGHTSTSSFSLKPVRACEVWNLDQGAGWAGRLTLMDVDTEEYWQSDDVQTLYPAGLGRAG